MLLRRLVANPIIEHWTHGTATPVAAPRHRRPSPTCETIAVRGLPADALARLGSSVHSPSIRRSCSPSRRHFEAAGRDPTDVELETLAQTWSEHCAHKTFRAAITIDDGTEVPSLLAQLRDATDTVAAPFVRSAFVGNAGIVSFSEGTTIALKAETHNHPSAVEPFGGANTGVGGVIRDVMGAAHRPVAVTDVLCFGPPDLPLDQAARRGAAPGPHRRRRDRRRGRLRQQDRVADDRRGGPLRPGLHDEPAGVLRLPRRGRRPSPAGRPVPRRPRRRRRRAHRPRRHPRGDVLQRHDGRHHRCRRRRQRADRRPRHREVVDRRAHRRRRPVDGDHRLRRRRSVVGGRGDGRTHGRRCRADRRPAQVPGPGAVGDLVVRGPGADGPRRAAGAPRRASGPLRPPWCRARRPRRVQR